MKEDYDSNVDVTDPESKVTIEVMEKEVFHMDGCIGKLVINLKDLAGGAEVTQKYELQVKFVAIFLPSMANRLHNIT